MQTRTRRLAIGGLAVMTAATWALLPADGQQESASGTFRYELMRYSSSSIEVLDRVSGRIYAIKSKEAGFMFDPVRGQSIVRPVKLLKTKAPEGKPTWPKREVTGGVLRYHAIRTGGRWSRSGGMFDAKTGKLYLIERLDSYLVIDAIESTVQEGKFKLTDPSGGGYNRNRNERSAIGALKTIATSQSLFREGDKDGDNTLDYGTLQELGDQSLIDTVLASGTKNGYRFAASHSPTTSEFLWWATANPVKPGKTGARHFATNQAGVIYYSTKGPIKVDPKTCEMPKQPDVNPVGH